MPSIRRSIKLLIPFFTILLIISYCKYKGSEQLRTYRKLHVGMTENDAEKLFYREPDFVCFYKSKKILYFCDLVSPFAHKPPSDIANNARIEKRENVPDIYDAIQILTDTSGKVEAYTWNGETYTINTVHDVVKGANVNKLDESYFE